MIHALKTTIMTIKSIFIFGLSYLFLSCGQQADKKEEYIVESTLEKNVIKDAENVDKQIIAEFEEIDSPHQQKLNKALADPTIDEYYKEIYRQQKLIIADDNKMLTIKEKLFSNDPDNDLFYFIVFTKSMIGSDGYNSEAVGLSAFKYVTEKSEQFADYFNNASNLTEQDMDNWAEYVYGEIQISRENEEKEAVKELETQLLDNIKGRRNEYKVVIDRFLKKIRSHMPDR
jgi:hypothetical protein